MVLMTDVWHSTELMTGEEVVKTDGTFEEVARILTGVI